MHLYQKQRINENDRLQHPAGETLFVYPKVFIDDMKSRRLTSIVMF